MGGAARVGVSGWKYAGWRGDFYPRGLPQRSELAYAASRFETLEVNASFYSLGRPSTYLRWYGEVPARTVLAVKGGRFVTHLKRLHDVRTALANFFGSGVLALDDKLGPILWQLPPDLPLSLPALGSFLRLLPHDTAAAKRLVRSAATLAPDRAWVERSPVRPVRHALEVRDESYRDPACYALLRRHGVALVVSDGAGQWPLLDEVTSDIVYVRLHGPERLYRGGYGPDLLRRWARRVRRWTRAGLDVYVYFDNDGDGRAPFDALSLSQLLGGSPGTAAGTGRACARYSTAVRGGTGQQFVS